MQLVIPARFRGPPHSGNGGYVAGLLGERVAGAHVARARLHAPPPLERPLELEARPDAVELRDGDAVVASGGPATLTLDVPAAPTLDDARAASARYVGFAKHPFPWCFVCGPERADGDGLRIFPGAISPGVVAAPFSPPDDLLSGDPPSPSTPIVWAALDCTGYFAIVGDEPVPMLLGELTVDVRAPLDRGPHVALGWSLGSEGRKARCGTALLSPEGRVLAVGLATWIRPKS